MEQGSGTKEGSEEGTAKRRNGFSVCACLGPTNGDPHCYCMMINLGLTPNKTTIENRKVTDVMKSIFQSQKM
jgi:hypothetical protein